MAEYEQAIVTFLDILGFSQVVRNRTPAEIEAMLDAISESAASPDYVGFTGGLATRILSFSDSVIRARHYGRGVRESTLLIELDELAVAQWLLVEHNILVRGGITAGPICMSENRAFGPAFVRAYDLETHLANSPRIVLDPTLLRELRENIQLRARGRSVAGEISVTRKYIRQGDDGLWFIDYLTALSWLLQNTEEHIAGMHNHKAMVTKMSEDLTHESPYLSKYLWLARYHNTVSRELYNGIRELRIGRKELPLFDELLLST